MSSRRADDPAGLRTRILVKAIEPVAAELRLVDVADYIAYIRFEQFANIQDIVNSSTELIFRPGALNYAWAADFELDWSHAPKVAIDMDFRHGAVSIAFTLLLSGDDVEASIAELLVDPSSGDPEHDTLSMADALADARLPQTLT